MSISTMYKEFKEGKEISRTIIHPDGRKAVYSEDYRGRIHVALFSRNGRFEGSHPINGKLAQSLKPGNG